MLVDVYSDTCIEKKYSISLFFFLKGSSRQMSVSRREWAASSCWK